MSLVETTSYSTPACQLHGVTTRITSSHSDVECGQEVGGLYSCVVAESLISSNQEYSIQVAAMNNLARVHSAILLMYLFQYPVGATNLKLHRNILI